MRVSMCLCIYVSSHSPFLPLIPWFCPCQYDAVLLCCPPQVVAYDFGIKQNILRRLASFGCSITVVPAEYPADKVLAMQPDGVFFSNGPVRGRDAC
jgi:Glutamine amidotransferase class-I